MKNIKINKITIENFKCHRHLAIDFGGRNASIYGDNATGKTSVYDALTWLLFAKDSLGNGEKNIEIKPLDEYGEVKDHLADTSVEATLLVDGEEIVLRRVYREVWSRKRGGSEETFDGNTSEYYIDGVPVKKFAFAEKVGELVDENTFKMLTSVTYFASGLAWQDRRAELFRISGVVSDADIMATDPTYKPLAEAMGRLSIDDYKKKLLAEKRGYVGAKTEIPARISECQRTVIDVESIDFESARAELEEINAHRERLEGELSALEHDAAQENKMVEIRSAKVDLSELEAENRVYRSSQSTGVDLVKLKKRRADLKDDKIDYKREIAQLEETIAETDKAIAVSRERWMEVHSRPFTKGSCPTCKQPLPPDQLKRAEEMFEASKKEHLKEIEQSAATLKAAKSRAEEKIKSASERLEIVRGKLSEIEDEIRRAECESVVEDIDGYAEKKAAIEARIKTLTDELAKLASGSIEERGRITYELQGVKRKAEEIRNVLGKESLLAYSKERIEKLQEEARRAAESLDRVEYSLYLIDEYTRYKTRYVEDSINGMFRLARFRLFREQANGGVEDRCDVVVDGVPYNSLNNAMKINVGVDIINTLSRAYGVTVPLFVDNAESVTRLERSRCQTIRLVVSENDKVLRWENED